MKRKHIKEFAIIILPALIVLAMPSNVFASVEKHGSDEEHVDFAAQVEFIRGHFLQAVSNKEANQVELAKAHAGHPVAEHFGVMAPEIKKHNQALHDELQTALDDLVNKVDMLSSADFKKEVDRIDVLLEDASLASLPSALKDDANFWIKVAIELLETAEHEYEEAVSEGEIKEMVEYQDAQGFVMRAEAIFTNIADKIDEHEREEIEIFFKDLRNGIDNVQSPEEIETFIGGIIHEFSEVAGLEREMTKQPSVANIKALLAKAVEEYEEGEYAEAEQLAIKAYLDNYEFLEASIEEKDPELMETTEIMIREEFRQLIKERAPVAQLKAKLDEINVNLDKILAMGIGVAEEGEEGEDPRLQYVKNIRMLLAKAVEEYEEGEYDEAMSFAIKAYLDNYEFLERDVDLADEELNEEIELMLRDELQDKIRKRAPTAEIKELASEINARMDAVEVIVPEFPVGLMIVMASIVGTMVALTRTKRLGLGLT